ncbi:MAG: hypothetical protein R2734_11410 [Nocardioides sp.]
MDGHQAGPAFVRDGVVHVLTDDGDVPGHRPQRCDCHLAEE